MHNASLTIIIAAGVFGCGAEDPAEVAVERPATTPYVVDDPFAGNAPTLGAQALSAALIDAAAATFDLDTPKVLEVIDHFLSYADEDCPEVNEYTSDDEVVRSVTGECVTLAGVRFDGDLTISTNTSEGALSWNGYGERFSVITPEDRFLYVSGSFAHETVTEGDWTEAHHHLAGRIAADAESAAGHPWLTDTLNGDISSWRGGAGSEDRGFNIHGALRINAGAVVAVTFDDFAGTKDACVYEPRGAVAIREVAGIWHDVVFDGSPAEPQDEAGRNPAVRGTLAGGCNGCGAWLVSGAVSGEVCLPGDRMLSLFGGAGETP